MFSILNFIQKCSYIMNAKFFMKLTHSINFLFMDHNNLKDQLKGVSKLYQVFMHEHFLSFLKFCDSAF